MSSPARLVLSPACENGCAHCPETGVKSLFNNIEATRPFEKSVILSCNSLFAETLPITLQEHYEKNISVQLEVNVSTAALLRWSDKLESLKDPLLSVIVIIDKWHSQKIAALQVLDDQVIEYRVLPSKLYPVALFQRELPVFVLRKLKWSYVPAFDTASPFLSADEMFCHNDANFNLVANAVSPTQPYRGANVHVVPVSADALWISTMSPAMNPLTKVQLETLQSAAWELKDHQVLWFPNNDSLNLSRQVQMNRKTASESFYFLDNALIARKTWELFLGSPESALIDHFSWSAFIKTHNINVKIQSTSLPSLHISLEQFSQMCHRRYARQPEAAFYEEFFCLFSAQPIWRRWILSLLNSVAAVLGYAPQSAVTALGHWTHSLRNTFSNQRFVANQAQRYMRKLLWRKSHDAYWLSHRGTWRLWEAFWRMMDGYWSAYHFYREARGLGRRATGHFAHFLFEVRTATTAFTIQSYWKTYASFWHYFFALRTTATLSAINTYWKTYASFWHHLFALRTAVTINFIRFYWKLYQIFWRLSDVYWWFFSRVLAPVVGFGRSLFVYPPTWEYEPWPRRWQLKIGVFLKKWGWLVLKMAGQR